MFDASQPLMSGHWCRALATLLISGLDTQQALTALKIQAASSHVALEKACSYAVIELQNGASLTQALGNYRFFNSYQLEQLRVAELSGKLPSMLSSLATRIEKQQARTQKLKAQLKFSQAVIVIGLLANVFIAMASHSSVWPQLCNLGLIILMTHILYRVLAIDVFALLARAWTYQVWFQIRFFRHLFEYYWYSLWVLQSQAGIDAAQVVANLRDLLPSATYRHHSRVCQRHVEDGKSLFYSLSQAELILTPTLKQVLLVGEKSGELINYLTHHLSLEEQRLDIVIKAFYEWLPRIYYVLALGVVFDVVF